MSEKLVNNETESSSDLFDSLLITEVVKKYNNYLEEKGQKTISVDDMVNLLDIQRKQKTSKNLELYGTEEPPTVALELTPPQVHALLIILGMNEHNAREQALGQNGNRHYYPTDPDQLKDSIVKNLLYALDEQVAIDRIMSEAVEGFKLVGFDYEHGHSIKKPLTDSVSTVGETTVKATTEVSKP